MKTLRKFVKWLASLPCKYGHHAYDNWTDAVIQYEVEGRSKPLKVPSVVRQCEDCGHLDEKPENGIWN